MKSPLWFHFIVLLSNYYLLVLISAEPLHGYNIVPAKPNEFSFIASLGSKVSTRFKFSRVHFCTGTLITPQHVLTVQHCIENKMAMDVDVIIGVTDWRTAKFKYDVDGWITYDQWTNNHEEPIFMSKSNIAVVKLFSAVKKPGITPVKLTDLNNLQLHRTKALIVGWGMTNEGEETSVLQKAKVKILTNSECEERNKLISNTLKKLHDKTLCSAADPYSLLSKGDSGGPLLDKNNILLGINGCTGPIECWGNFSDKFINKHKINVHYSIDYYKNFILNVTSV